MSLNTRSEMLWALFARIPSRHQNLRWRVTAAACFVLLTGSHAKALETESLQLKWLHQFQFAGYYQALEQGFYRQAGLQVEIREGGPGTVVSEAVERGRADFGV